MEQRIGEIMMQEWNLDALLQQLLQQGVQLWVEGEQLRVRAPQGVLTADVRTALTTHKDALIKRLQRATQSDDPLPTVIAAPAVRHEPFPLTDIQHAYWIGGNMPLELGNVGIHYYGELLCRNLDINRLAMAWNALIARHEMLRSIILPDGQQQILPEVPFYPITTLDLRHQPPAGVEQQRLALRSALSHQNLPTDQWPPFDLRVVQLDDEQSCLAISLNLLSLDFGSCQTLFQEWFTLYQAPQVELPPLALSYRDYLLAEKQLEASPRYQQARDYWLARLETLPPAPDLPLSRPPSAVAKPHFTRQRFALPQTQWAQFKQYSEQAGVTPTSALLALFGRVLAAWSKTATFTLNLTLFNRLPLHPQVNQIVGDFTTINLLAVDGSPTLSLRDQAQQVQRQLWQDLDHRSFSGVQVLREWARRRGQASGTQTVGQALMPIVFTSALGLAQDGSNFPAFGETLYEISQTPQVMLDHVVMEEEGKLLLHWDVVADLFPPGLIEAMFEVYCHLLCQLASAPGSWHDPHLPLLPVAQAAQRQQVNNTAAPLAPDLLHTRFLAQVATQAEQPAVITPTCTLTYAELSQRANQVGHWLRRRGAKPNTLVAVVMEKGWEQIVAVLGIQLAGAAYLPIDPNLPTERQHYLLAQGETTLILTQSCFATSLVWPAALEWVAVDQLAIDDSAFADLPALEIAQSPTDLAYVIYTSGSTGLPKGVVIDQRGAVNTVLDINQRFGVTAKDRVLGLSALNFDLSVYDIFGPLAVGGAIVLPDAELRNDPAHWLDLMNRYNVTVWDTVPALMQMLVDYVETNNEMTRWQGDKVTGTNSVPPSPYHPLTLSPLHLVMLSGDWIPLTLPDRIKRLWPQAAVYSLGGATEASIWSIYYPIGCVDPNWTSIPYGKPLTNQTFHVLDEQLNPRPVWVTGELYIGGIGLALGYWKDAAKSNERFLSHPRTGERLYKTGDLGRYLPDGNIEFLGRADFQVKIRGHRIELGEIEAALLQAPAVKEAVVSAIGAARETNKQLVAYIVPKEKPGENGKRPKLDAIPDRYQEDESGIQLLDPVARMEFKLSQPGLRTLNGAARVDLQPIDDETVRPTYLARQSYRQFCDTPIPFANFSHLLGNLRQLQVAASPLPKYRYPSAGSLYPVQTYLYVKAGRVETLAEGFYYYQPATHQLARLQDGAGGGQPHFAAVNQPIFAQAAFALFLVGELNAITPMYGKLARDFCLLEAGYMSQLLMMQATEQQLGLCPIGGIAEDELRAMLRLSESHLLLHSLVGGRIEPVQMTQWLQPAQPTQAAGAQEEWSNTLRTFLQQKLPAYMVPSHYVELDALPLSANGKVNRQALPLPRLDEGAGGTSSVAPRTPLEAQIAELWREVLNQPGHNPPTVSVEEDFFASGGDSLSATRLLARLRQQVHGELTLRTLYTHPTIAQLAGVIEAESLRSIDPALLQAALQEIMA
jgi:epothilone synthetase B